MNIRRPSPMALALAAATLVIIGLAAALVAVTNGHDDNGAHASTAKPTPASAAAVKPAPMTVAGTVTMKHYDELKSANWRKLGDLNCEGIGGYDDMTEGAVVTVYDAAGTVVAAGALSKGLKAAGLCAWSFVVDDVPPAAIYQVEVSHRGKVTVQRADAGTITLSLG